LFSVSSSCPRCKPDERGGGERKKKEKKGLELPYRFKCLGDTLGYTSGPEEKRQEKKRKKKKVVTFRYFKLLYYTSAVSLRVPEKRGRGERKKVRKKFRFYSFGDELLCPRLSRVVRRGEGKRGGEGKKGKKRKERKSPTLRRHYFVVQNGETRGTTGLERATGGGEERRGKKKKKKKKKREPHAAVDDLAFSHYATCWARKPGTGEGKRKEKKKKKRKKSQHIPHRRVVHGRRGGQSKEKEKKRGEGGGKKRNSPILCQYKKGKR